jgi:VIT1/CCC1 family predicted Fe2+/Mn2+ transporter
MFPLPQVVLVLIAPAAALIPVVAAGSLAFLGLLGYLGARTGGVGTLRPTIRVTFWGALAMAITAGIGALIGTTV